jgi:putative component of membrane protein insertase Oxa1/YidC/SpoIIIJ protein YidD
MRPLLALAIRGYRRYLSGRGPLRRVRCTFHATESCSAYGLRAVEQLSTSFPHALRLVRARIRMCRCTSIYRFEHGLGWERDHELEPAALMTSLVERGEHDDTIAQVLAARTVVAKWCGDRDAYASALQLRDGARGDVYASNSARASSGARASNEVRAPNNARAVGTPRHHIPLRAGDAAILHHRHVMCRGLVLAAVAAVIAFISWIAVVPMVLAVGAAASARTSAKRLERQRIASRFLRPALRQHAADAAGRSRISTSWTSCYSAREAGSVGWSPAS